MTASSSSAATKGKKKGRQAASKVQKTTSEQKEKNKYASAGYRQRTGQGQADKAKKYLVSKAVHTRLMNDLRAIHCQLSDTRKLIELHLRFGRCTCRDLIAYQVQRDDAFMDGLPEHYPSLESDTDGVLRRAIRNLDIQKIRDDLKDSAPNPLVSENPTPGNLTSDASAQGNRDSAQGRATKGVADRKAENKEAVRKSRANDRAEKNLRDAMIKAFDEVNIILAKDCANFAREEANLTRLLIQPRTCEATMVNRPHAERVARPQLTAEGIFQCRKYLLDDTVEKLIRHKGRFDGAAAQLSVAEAAQAEYHQLLQDARLQQDITQGEALQQNAMQRECVQQDNMDGRGLHQENMQGEFLHQDNMQGHLLIQENMPGHLMHQENMPNHLLHQDNMPVEFLHQDNMQDELLHQENMPGVFLHQDSMQDEFLPLDSMLDSMQDEFLPQNSLQDDLLQFDHHQSMQAEFLQFDQQQSMQDGLLHQDYIMQDEYLHQGIVQGEFPQGIGMMMAPVGEGDFLLYGNFGDQMIVG